MDSDDILQLKPGKLAITINGCIWKNIITNGTVSSDGDACDNKGEQRNEWCNRDCQFVRPSVVK